VEDEVDPLDPERRQRFGDEACVALGRVLEAGRRLGLAEVRQVEGDGSRPGRADCLGEPHPVVGRAGVAMDEDHRLGGVFGAGFDQPGLTEPTARRSRRALIPEPARRAQ